MPRIPDNYDAFTCHDRKQQEWLKTRPVCSVCEEPIQDETYFEINGEPVCKDCLVRDYQKYTEDYVA